MQKSKRDKKSSKKSKSKGGAAMVVEEEEVLEPTAREGGGVELLDLDMGSEPAQVRRPPRGEGGVEACLYHVT